jgi:AraC-like DNA-binding protein
MVGAEAKRQPTLMLVGELRRQVSIVQAGTIDLVGVRLRPGALGLLFPEPAHRLVDGNFDLEGLLTGRQRQSLSVLRGVDSDTERVTLLTAWLLERLRAADTDDRLVRQAVAAIERLHGNLIIDDLADALDATPRTLERNFKALVGISPKAFARVRRFRQALSLCEQGHPISSVALDCGYVDQAHLTRDFRAHAGDTPAHFLSQAYALNQMFADAPPAHADARV